MKWEKTANREWTAKGKRGTFFITQSGRVFWSQFSSGTQTFKMPPKRKLSEAKAMCEANCHWEATV